MVVSHHRRLGNAILEKSENADRSSLEEVSGNYPHPFPVTTAVLLWAIHLLYYFQWFRRRNRRYRPIVSFRKLTHLKQFHIVWLAAFSVLQKKKRTSSATENESRVTITAASSQLEVPMGNDITRVNGNGDGNIASIEAWISRTRAIIQSSLEANILGQRLLALVASCYQSFDRLGGSALTRLVYHSHLIWACRSLEGGRGSWAYLHLLTSLVLAGTVFEVGFVRMCLRFLANGQFGSERPAASYLVGLLMNGGLAVVSLNALTSALLMLFRMQFPHVSIPILPFLPSFGNPVISQFSCMLILGLLCRQRDASIALWWGCGLGWLWGVASFTEYWERAATAAMITLTVLSIRVKYGPSSVWLKWIEHVGWSRRGRVLVYSEATNDWVEHDTWLELPQNIRIESEADSDEMDEGMDAATEAASGSEEDATELTPLVDEGTSNVRSRRIAS